MADRGITAEQALVDFLQWCANSTASLPRVRCPTCNASRSLYCPLCFHTFIPREEWPQPLLDQSLKIPFQFDIIVDDRRTSATGVQVASVLKSAGLADEDGTPHFRLFDLTESSDLPLYAEETGVFLLFPSPASKSFSAVPASDINRLILLDCKWSRPSSRFHPALERLPHLHLDICPQHSFYWRWHNAGPGMISTIEALYYSAWEVAKSKGWCLQDRKKLVCLLWLFGLQREVIRRKYEQDGGQTLPVHLPFTEDGKQYQRELRATLARSARSNK